MLTRLANNNSEEQLVVEILSCHVAKASDLCTRVVNCHYDYLELKDFCQLTTDNNGIMDDLTLLVIATAKSHSPVRFHMNSP